MQPTHEIRTKIFGLYLGCEVKESYHKEPGILYGLFGHKASVIHHNTSWNFPIDECQLILTDLSEITDEDCITVFELEHPNSKSTPESKIEDVKFWIEKGAISYFVADKLRELRYMLPAYGIENLFEAEIAVRKQKEV